MTLEQFRAARRVVDDLALAVPPEFSEQYQGPGIVYPGDLVIELAPNSDDYCLTIANTQRMGSLAELEKELYDWAIAEDITEVVS